MRKQIEWREGFLDFNSVPSAPLVEHTAHRWCQTLSEKQKLSGGKFPMPDWTENKTYVRKNWSASCSCLYSAWWLRICQEQQEIFIWSVTLEFSCGSKDTLNIHLLFKVWFQIQSTLSQFCLLGLWVELQSDALFSFVLKPFRALSKRHRAFQLLCQRKWPKYSAGC